MYVFASVREAHINRRKQTDRETNKQTDRQTEIQIDKLS